MKQQTESYTAHVIKAGFDSGFALCNSLPLLLLFQPHHTGSTTAPTKTRCYTTSLMLQAVTQAPATHQPPVLTSVLEQLQNRCCSNAQLHISSVVQDDGRFYYRFVLGIAPQSTAAQKAGAPKLGALLISHNAVQGGNSVIAAEVKMRETP